MMSIALPLVRTIDISKAPHQNQKPTRPNSRIYIYRFQVLRMQAHGQQYGFMVIIAIRLFFKHQPRNIAVLGMKNRQIQSGMQIAY
jgi:hypothetical protein